MGSIARTNKALVQLFNATRPNVDDEQQRCINELREQGICISSVAALTGDHELLGRLKEDSNHLLGDSAVQNQIDVRRATKSPKWYVIRALGYDSHITLPKPLAELFVHPRLLAVVNHYLAQYCRLGSANLWYNIPVGEDEPSIDSERWHRDHEDRRIIKLFCFVNEIDETMGPFRYIRGSHPNGPFGHLFPAKPPRGSYPDSRELETAIPAKAQIICTGPAGTLVIVDTAGFHQGGRSSTRPRIVLTSTYVSEAGLDQRRIDLAHSMALQTSAKIALRLGEL